MIRLARLVSPLVLVAAVLPVRPARSGPSVAQLALKPSGVRQAPQGMGFRFDAMLTNPGPSQIEAGVTFSLAPVGTEAPVAFSTWFATLPAGGSAQTSRKVVSARWFAGLGPYRVTAESQDGATASLTYRVLVAPVPVPTFEDVTAASGIDTTLPAPTSCSWAAGAAWADVEGDGDLDLYVPHPDAPAQLWINDGSGHFTDQAAARGVDNGGSTGLGAVFADYDHDGDQDLYVSNAGANRLFQNDGSGHFSDVAHAAGVDDTRESFSASWGDYDGDGWLDLYVTNYQRCGTRPGHGRSTVTADSLYHNEGDGTFTDQTALLPPLSTEGAGFQAGWFDYDGDGDPDLYLANDSLQEVLAVRNHLFRNDGPSRDGTWTFTDVSEPSHTNYEINSMGLGIADVNRDLRLDFAVSNIGATVLARNNGDGTFTDVASALGVARPLQDATRTSITWGLAFADFNLDGWEDLYVNAGALIVLEPQPNELFANLNGAFLDLSAPSGAADPGVSRGLALADYDRDGRMDVFVVNQGGPARLFRNVTPYGGRHWLEVHLTGVASNTDACGGRLIFTVAGGQMLREVFCGSTGLSSGADPTVHVGLGAATSVDQIQIGWPSGVAQTLTAVPSDQVLTVQEPAPR